jgi:hypothetical protein
MVAPRSQTPASEDHITPDRFTTACLGTDLGQVRLALSPHLQFFHLLFFIFFFLLTPVPVDLQLQDQLPSDPDTLLITKPNQRHRCLPTARVQQTGSQDSQNNSQNGTRDRAAACRERRPSGGMEALDEAVGLLREGGRRTPD